MVKGIPSRVFVHRGRLAGVDCGAGALGFALLIGESVLLQAIKPNEQTIKREIVMKKTFINNSLRPFYQVNSFHSRRLIKRNAQTVPFSVSYAFA